LVCNGVMYLSRLLNNLSYTNFPAAASTCLYLHIYSKFREFFDDWNFYKFFFGSGFSNFFYTHWDWKVFMEKKDAHSAPQEPIGALPQCRVVKE